MPKPKPKTETKTEAKPVVVTLVATRTIRHGTRRVVAGTRVQSDDTIVARCPNYFEKAD